MINAHKLEEIPFYSTPNIGGTMESVPTAIVIHYTGGGSLDSAVNWLLDPLAKASAHIVLGEEGEMVQLVPFNQVAWHAGKSSYNGLTNFNQFSIGLEIVNPGQLTKVGSAYCSWFGKEYPSNRVVEVENEKTRKVEYWCAYTQAQIEAIKHLVLLFKNHYPIKMVLAHSEISPQRKRDPGPAFPMTELRRQVLDIDRHEHHRIPGSLMSLKGKVTASQLNLRTRIGGDARIGPLVRGQELKILQEQSGWYQVEVKESGWVKKEFVTIFDES